MAAAVTTAAGPWLRVSLWDQPHHTHPHSPTGTGSGARRPGKCSPLPWDLHRQRPGGGRESEGEKVPGEKMWVPEGRWGWGGGLGERVRSMGPSWTRGERRWENTEDGETQKRLRQGEGRRGGKGERCGETFALGLQELFIKPQKWVGSRRADRWRDETERLETDTAREQEAARDPPTEKMWPTAQAADRVRDAVRPRGRQGQRPRATQEDTGVEGRKRPKREILSLFSPQGSRGDTGGMQEGIEEVAEAKRPRRGSGPQPLPPTCPLGGTETTAPRGGLVAEGSKVRGRAGVLGPGFGGSPLTVQPLG